MKVSFEIRYMLKRIAIIDFIISIILFLGSFMLIKKFMFPILIGFMIAVVNFYVNSLTTNFTFNSKNLRSGLIIFLSFLFRVFIVGIIGVFLFKINKYYIVAFIFGYTCHLISVLIYGTTIRENSEGK